MTRTAFSGWEQGPSGRCGPNQVPCEALLLTRPATAVLGVRSSPARAGPVSGVVRRPNAMNDPPSIPTSLKVVAALFILSGMSSLIEIVVSLSHGHISINLGVLGLFIGAGLLRLSPTWRTWALVFTWIALVGAPLVGLIFLIVPGPVDVELFGQPVGQAPKAAGVAVAGVVFLVAVWQDRVLTRPEVRALFRPPTAAPRAAADRGRESGSAGHDGSSHGPGD